MADEGKLTAGQYQVLGLLVRESPDPVTIFDEGGLLFALRDKGLIQQFDMWPDGSRRWIITPAGRLALETADAAPATERRKGE